MQVFGVFAVLLFVLGAVSVNAQSGCPAVSVNVPFDFAVGNEILPKGEYIGISERVQGDGVGLIRATTAKVRGIDKAGSRRIQLRDEGNRAVPGQLDLEGS